MKLKDIKTIYTSIVTLNDARGVPSIQIGNSLVILLDNNTFISVTYKSVYNRFFIKKECTRENDHPDQPDLLLAFRTAKSGYMVREQVDKLMFN